MDHERLADRYVEAIRYFNSPESDAMRALYVGSDHFSLCYGYVIWTVDKQAKRIPESDHREAYLAAQGRSGDVYHADVRTL